MLCPNPGRTRPVTASGCWPTASATRPPGALLPAPHTAVQGHGGTGTVPEGSKPPNCRRRKAAPAPARCRHGRATNVPAGTTAPSLVPGQGCPATQGSRHPKPMPTDAGRIPVLHPGYHAMAGRAGMPVSQLYPTFPAPTAGVRRWLMLSQLPPLYIPLRILGSAAGTWPGSPTSVHGRAQVCKTSSGFSVLPSRGTGCSGL